MRERSYYGHVSGNVAQGQSLYIEGCAGTGNPAVLEGTASLTNEGTITLTSAKRGGTECGGGSLEARLQMASGKTLTNKGTIAIEAGTVSQTVP